MGEGFESVFFWHFLRGFWSALEFGSDFGEGEIAVLGLVVVLETRKAQMVRTCTACLQRRSICGGQSMIGLEMELSHGSIGTAEGGLVGVEEAERVMKRPWIEEHVAGGFA